MRSAKQEFVDSLNAGDKIGVDVHGYYPEVHVGQVIRISPTRKRITVRYAGKDTFFTGRGCRVIGSGRYYAVIVPYTKQIETTALHQRACSVFSQLLSQLTASSRYSTVPSLMLVEASEKMQAIVEYTATKAGNTTKID